MREPDLQPNIVPAMPDAIPSSNASRSATTPARAASTLLAACLLAPPCLAQGSTHSLRSATGTGGEPGRIVVPVDDDAPGAASTPADVGQAGFTVEFWIKGSLADNGGVASDGPGAYADERWKLGRIVLDRGLSFGSEREWGASLAQGRVRFGAGRGDGAGADPTATTIEGATNVLDGAWHHVALVRTGPAPRGCCAAGALLVYVDGVLDAASAAGSSVADISYPDAGGLGERARHLVLFADRETPAQAAPFVGSLDELRLWSVGRNQAEIQAWKNRVPKVETPRLVASWRMDDGIGVTLNDVSGAGAPQGLFEHAAGGGLTWEARAVAPDRAAPVAGDSLPDGWRRVLVSDALDEATTVLCLRDGRVLVGERDGRVRIVVAGALLANDVVQVPSDTSNGERGLMALAVAGDFAATRHLYAYGTAPNAKNRIVRYTMNGDAVAPGSETLVWECPVQAQLGHNGGGFAFGGDGRIYLSIGEHYSSPNSQDLATPLGKLLRMERDGSAPSDNPFVGVPGAEERIWSLGLRNPFRLAVDPLDGAIWIGDVGGNSPLAHEEINRAARGANHGWPAQEGDACSSGDCSAYAPPAWSVRHDDRARVPVVGRAGVILGPVVRHPAWPTEMQGDLIVADYPNRLLRRVAFDASGAVAADPLFLASPEAGTVTDLDFAPDGSLWTTTFGPLWGGSSERSSLHRIERLGAGNQPPVAIATASATAGATPLLVQFQGSSSYDPDGGPASLSFLWEFGDGATATTADAQHAYAIDGEYAARLTVDDGAANAISTTIQVRAGNPPLPVIAAPASPSELRYVAGQTIAYAGTASDPEDGAIPGSSLSWRVLLLHGGHTHPFHGPVQGASGSFTIPSTGHSPEATSYQVELEARDSSGLVGRVVTNLAPTPSALQLRSAPAGVPIFVDGESTPTPWNAASLQGFVHELEAQRWLTSATQILGFVKWSDGDTARRKSWTAPAGGGALLAQYGRIAPRNASARVTSAARDAQWDALQGVLDSDPGLAGSILFGRDANGAREMGVSMPLQVPRGATILSARLRLQDAGLESGGVLATVRCIALDDAPPFALGAQAARLSSQFPLTVEGVLWNFQQGLGTGGAIHSQDLAPIVQDVVDRPTWNPGQSIGFVLDAAPSPVGAAWRVRAHPHPNLAVLEVTWGVPEPRPRGTHAPL